jgi:hypothetical protein
VLSPNCHKALRWRCHGSTALLLALFLRADCAQCRPRHDEWSYAFGATIKSAFADAHDRCRGTRIAAKSMTHRCAWHENFGASSIHDIDKKMRESVNSRLLCCRHCVILVFGEIHAWAIRQAL